MAKHSKLPLILGIPIAAAAGTFALSEYFFRMGMNRRTKKPKPSKTLLPYAKEYYQCLNWYNNIHKEVWRNTDSETDEVMVADFIPNETPTNKTVIIAHGYNGTRETMSAYAKMYYEMGFNVMLPDDRGHGESAGKYVSFGWLDQKDYLAWIDRVIKRVGPDSRILLFGVSMGAGIVSMLSGDDLPPQVEAIIADCGYSSVSAELKYLLQYRYNLPEYPFEALVSSINKRRLGYYLNDASTTKQLQKNHLPILIIHGSEDTYVPTFMAYENYRASDSPKQLWIVKGAKHAESFWKKPVEYRQRVSDFLKTYFN
ncbi:alpha/beta hydrolase [Nicoliella spurrieriana]|uniref:Alpha/beta hydrolase n=1 Tax=Nicoliella spurrieriana TaxID=2925830 RepID=A0A976X5X8_9LACO|nr:alpha/beta hydrolase [Nicoliella spurrieriana]UQS87121.1 alpha/beta hydrolase [Nicoliella spurrieriana]